MPCTALQLKWPAMNNKRLPPVASAIAKALAPNDPPPPPPDASSSGAHLTRKEAVRRTGTQKDASVGPHAGVGVPKATIGSVLQESQDIEVDLDGLSTNELNILRVLSDPEFVGKSNTAKWLAAGVSEATWYRHAGSQKFRRIASVTAREALLGVERELYAVARKYAVEGSWKHFEWLASQAGMVATSEKAALDGTSGQDLHLHYHQASADVLEHYVKTGEWTGRLNPNMPTPEELEARDGKK